MAGIDLIQPVFLQWRQLTAHTEIVPASFVDVGSSPVAYQVMETHDSGCCIGGESWPEDWRDGSMPYAGYFDFHRNPVRQVVAAPGFCATWYK